MTGHVLEGVDLTLTRGHRKLFRRLSFSVRSGSALLVRGPNGSGKTTLLRAVCGLTRPEEGTVFWDRKPVAGPPGEFLAYGGHLPALKSDLSVVENLRLAARACGVEPAGVDLLLKRLDVHRCRSLEVRLLSAGQRHRVALARVFLSPAPAWVIDEPFANLDDRGRALVEEALAAHLRCGGLAMLAVHQPPRLGNLPVQTLLLGERVDMG